ncbi:Hint domain-containing protein [Sedimentimonas flavescens]|uniref:Hint domain-containing protein n=1 Tax=Sedimentimonas flavescens TaxID=2851012 RepID=UPI0021A53AFC|nr:Hint domain-containing protein [Sedimentimonas flavescens]MCT2539065.1 Hint domain-containing protein [Sedimentimonas flavescens]
MGVAISGGDRSGPSHAHLRGHVGTERRPLRAIPLTRRYEAAWLTSSGEIETSNRIAPAIPLFEHACSALARGAVVQTAAGPCAIEDLMPGSQVLVAGGETCLVRWIGSMTHFAAMRPDCSDGRTCMTRLTAEALGEGRPVADLVLGPGARIRMDSARVRRIADAEAAFVPACALVDGIGIIEVAPVAPITTYHVVLDRHAALRVAGVEVESYHPGVGLEQLVDPRMLELFVALFPHIRRIEDFGEMALPRLGMKAMAALWE